MLIIIFANKIETVLHIKLLKWFNDDLLFLNFPSLSFFNILLDTLD